MPKHLILLLAANPVGTDRLALDREARAIQVELERSGFRDSFELVTRWAAEPLDLLRELRKLKPTVVHFSGHGTSGEVDIRRTAEGPHRDVAAEECAFDPAQHGLYFQGPDGRPQLVSAEAVLEVFEAAGSSVKLVTLSACYSDAQAEALRTQVGCVVGMRGSIRDDAARSFAIGFYGGLGECESVAAAYRQGCAAIGLEGLPSSDKPRLRVRDGFDAERVVLADLASGDPAARSRRIVSAPMPAYANAEVRALSEQIEDARTRKQSLRAAGLATDEVDREILELRRRLREGGQLRSGDSLSDGRYLLVKHLGRGGFAVVWEAWDRNEQQRVAVKVLHANLAGDPQRRERFIRGAQAMRRLGHPAVVRALEPTGEDGGFYYFVMELVPGGNLHEAVLERRVQREDVLPLIMRVGEALALAHSMGMIHRDVKPANILLDDQGNAKLTDFDLVMADDTTGGTCTGALGTVIYAAPECLHQPQHATTRADVFGLGMTAIFCLSGQDLTMDTLMNRAAALARLGCAIPVRKVLARAVEWKPERRFADATAMVDALRDALASSSQSAGADDRRADEPAKEHVAKRGLLGHLSGARRWGGFVAGGLLVVVITDAVHRVVATSPDVRRPNAADVLPPISGAGIAARSAAAPPPGASGDVQGCPADMVAVAAGTFVMGSPSGEGYDNEHPAQAVTLSAYCIDRTEVTVKAYTACVRAGACSAAEERAKTGGGNACNGARTDRQDHPINCIDWAQAQAYCAWAGRRLPTEAEWEYAARGSDGREYPWGKDAPTARRLNACGGECAKWAKHHLKVDWGTMYAESDGWETTAPVGSFPDGASPFGALDMAGNIWEWTADWFASKYDGKPAKNPRGPATGTARVLRGGGWDDVVVPYIRAANRYWDDPALRNGDVGFRCVRGP